MADTDQAINLMRHAADLLDTANPTIDYLRLITAISSSSDRASAASNLARVSAAQANAIATLRLVAAALERGAEDS